MSALGLQRVLGLGSYQTAWAWLHKLRRAMVRPDRDALEGIVEVDETLIGGVKPGKRGRGADGKVLAGGRHTFCVSAVVSVTVTPVVSTCDS